MYVRQQPNRGGGAAAAGVGGGLLGESSIKLASGPFANYSAAQS